MQRILIVGGGFGGIKAAQELSRMASAAEIRLIDPKLRMEYHAAVYRLVTGRSAAEVCIPYADLLRGTETKHERDAVASIDLCGRVAFGVSGSRYAYDTLIVAAGAEPSYFGIEGIAEHAYGIGSVEQALRLRRHLHEAFAQAATLPPERRGPALRFVVIGGGASGVEMAGELASYARTLARDCRVAPSLVRVDLVEALPRLLSTMPERVSRRVEERLRSLGVHLLLGQSVVRSGDGELVLKGERVGTETVVWTAGLKASGLLTRISGLALDKRGRAVVDDFLRVPGHPEVFVIGDAAATRYGGMAQTALADASYVARAVRAQSMGRPLPVYRQPAPSYAVPVGPHWAAVQLHGLHCFGRLGWILRRAADLRVFLSLLPLPSALRAFRGGFASEREEVSADRSVAPKNDAILQSMV